MARQPKRSQNDDKSGWLSALQKFADKYLVGEEAQGLFDEADKIPVFAPTTPIKGFQNPIPNNLTAGLMAKAGGYTRAGAKTNLAKWFGGDELMRLSGPPRPMLNEVGDVASLLAMILPFGPSKKYLSKPKQWMATLNSLKALFGE